jgi:beta-glucosidase
MAGSTSITGAVEGGAGTDAAPGPPSNECLAISQALVGQLNLDQQIMLMHGEPSDCPGNLNLDNNYTTPGIPYLVVRGLSFRYGPRGVCLAANLPPEKSGYSTAFPSASARGATFDYALEQAIGADIGDEMIASSHNMSDAPDIDTLRHPAWGRSQEAYGEDSYHVGRMGTAFALGAQQYMAACATHLAAYNIENGRQANTAVMDEQTLYEIYGRPFEMAIQDANVAAVMAADNLVQATDGPDNMAYKCAESPALLTTMLRQTFAFQGFVLTDFYALPGAYFACPTIDPTEQGVIAAQAVNAGLDMELPVNDNFTQLEADVFEGGVPASAVQTAATDIVETQCRFNILNPTTGMGLKAAVTTQDPASYNILGNASHVADARQAATEGMVLLKNEPTNGVPTLPIPSTVKTIAVVGATVPFSLANTDIAKGTVDFITSAMTGYTTPTFLTGDLGSSRVYPDPTQFAGPLLGLTNGAPTGVTIVSGGGSPATIPTTADLYVVIAGMTPEDEGEDSTGASDRLSFMLDDKNVHVEGLAPVQNPLIASVAALGKPMVVVLEGGSVIEMPWLSTVPAVVMAWYPGQDGGAALADLLFGKKNFSGKLPVTWPNPSSGTCTGMQSCPKTGPCPACFGDEPLFTAGPGAATPISYFHGYRYYDENGTKPLFAFGAGLSYTTFAYGASALSTSTATPADTVNVTFPVTNAGAAAGDEVSFLFVSYPNTKRTGHKPVKELKGFVRTAGIMRGSTVMVTIPLRVADLKYWDTPTGKWVYETGPIQVMVGGSSDRLLAPVVLTLQ